MWNLQSKQLFKVNDVHFKQVLAPTHAEIHKRGRYILYSNGSILRKACVLLETTMCLFMLEYKMSRWSIYLSPRASYYVCRWLVDDVQFTQYFDYERVEYELVAICAGIQVLGRSSTLELLQS